MRTVALIFLTVSALVGTVGAVSAQYGGGYFGPGPYYGGRYYDDGRISARLPVWSHHRIRQISAGRNGIFLLGQAVVVRGITPSKMDLNRIRIAAPRDTGRVAFPIG